MGKPGASAKDKDKDKAKKKSKLALLQHQLASGQVCMSTCDDQDTVARLLSTFKSMA